jgi:hypothetical protein
MVQSLSRRISIGGHTGITLNSTSVDRGSRPTTHWSKRSTHGFDRNVSISIGSCHWKMRKRNSLPGRSNTTPRDHTVLWVTGHRSKVSQNRPMLKLPQHETVPKTNTEIGPTMGASTPIQNFLTKSWIGFRGAGQNRAWEIARLWEMLFQTKVSSVVSHRRNAFLSSCVGTDTETEKFFRVFWRACISCAYLVAFAFRCMYDELVFFHRPSLLGP